MNLNESLTQTVSRSHAPVRQIAVPVPVSAHLHLLPEIGRQQSCLGFKLDRVEGRKHLPRVVRI